MSPWLLNVLLAVVVIIFCQKESSPQMIEACCHVRILPWKFGSISTVRGREHLRLNRTSYKIVLILLKPRQSFQIVLSNISGEWENRASRLN